MNFVNTFSVNIPFWSDVKMKKKNILWRLVSRGEEKSSWAQSIVNSTFVIDDTWRSSIDFFAADVIDIIPVIAKSSENLYITKTIDPAKQTEVFKTGQKLGDCAIVKTGVTLKSVDPETDRITNYFATKLTVEFLNKNDVVKNTGINKEPVLIYVTANPSIWVQIEYEFDAEQASGIPPATITMNPVIESPVKYTENMKVSALKLSGGEANVEGVFSFTEPDKALGLGTNQVSVTFTPADPTQAEAVTFTIPVTVEKGRSS